MKAKRHLLTASIFLCELVPDACSFEARPSRRLCVQSLTPSSAVIIWRTLGESEPRLLYRQDSCKLLHNLPLKDIRLLVSKELVGSFPKYAQCGVLVHLGELRCAASAYAVHSHPLHGCICGAGEGRVGRHPLRHGDVLLL